MGQFLCLYSYNSHFWFRDLLRELDKKYEVLLIIFFHVFLLFLVSEGLLFVSFFWTSFHSLSSSTLGTWPGEGFYLIIFISWDDLLFGISFSSWNYYYITNYHWNLLRFTLYIRSGIKIFSLGS